MKNGHRTHRWYDPRSGEPPIRVDALQLRAEEIFEPARTNYFGIYWLKAGRGAFWADAAQHAFAPHSLLFYLPYQHVRIAPATAVRGQILHFHANFLCVETFHAEVGCSGLLFNDPYNAPIVRLDEAAQAEVAYLLERICREQAEQELAHSEVSLSYLKVLLVLASRRKSATATACSGVDPRHPVLAELRELVEHHYRTLHAPADYAARLHMTPKTLGRIVREHLGQTLTELIQARILTHAKWELLHTLKPVKEIARELGFQDELYFSRLFKKGTGCAPKFFREFETEIRGGSNLSMLSDHAPMPSNAAFPDTSRKSAR